jgi:nicotinamide-nucleotide amidase
MAPEETPMTSDDRMIFRSAEIISVGTELLVGQIVDTNAHFLSEQLSQIGLSTYRHVVVGDNTERLEQAIRHALTDNDLVITTGGLGPTEDDITALVAARVAGVSLVSNRDITDRLESRGRYVSPGYPLIPEGSRYFHNDNGTAPGSLTFFTLNRSQKAILMLPGPPDEMEPMFLRYVRPVLEMHSAAKFVHRYVRLTGIGESRSEDMIRDLIDSQDEVTIAPYANPGEVVFRVSQRLESGDDDKTDEAVEAIVERVGEFVFEIGQRTLNEVVLDMLVSRGETCAFAESCTGGMLASSLASIPGASKALLGGFITYNDEMKQSLLGVPRDILEGEGAVSEECVRAMADHCRLRTGADYALAVSGFAGPSGGTEDTPVGTVYIALSKCSGLTVKRFFFRGDRERVMRQSVVAALNLLRRGMIDG